jgi:hypothetical protein
MRETQGVVARVLLRVRMCAQVKKSAAGTGLAGERWMQDACHLRLRFEHGDSAYGSGSGWRGVCRGANGMPAGYAGNATLT